MFLTEPEEMEPYHIDEVIPMLGNEQLRNFQVLMSETFGVENFVASFNRHTNIDGTFEYNSDNERWFAIINPNIRVEKVL